MQHLNNLSVLVLGLGASGLAMARWCALHGAQVTVADTRANPPQLAALLAQCPQVRFVAGPLGADLIEGTPIRAVFRSPGLAPEVVAPVLQAARAAGLWLGGELSLFVAALRELQQGAGYSPQVLAITGTNGKTTVTTLTGLLVAHAGKQVKVAGNIGPTLLDTLSESLTQQMLPEVWVLELSSFQLDSSEGFEPSAATVLNISQDHLDWHGSMPAYAQAKSRIFGQQALMVLNRDDAAVMAMLGSAGGSAGSSANTGAAEDAATRAPARAKAAKTSGTPAARAHLSFGADLPQRAGDYGLETVNGMTWLVRALPADETHKKRKHDEEPLHLQRLMPADALRIRGRHNAVNALAALALASSAGCALAPMLYALREYRGEPHRVEPVAIVDEVEYFDDSKGTNVGATVAALQGLGAERRVVLILGGEGKGQDFSPLRAPVAQYARAVVLIGRDAPFIAQALADTGVPLQPASDLPQAVALCAQSAQAGDAVLLSPACASFDMFRDYAHRAEVFRAAVADLAQAKGQSLEGQL